jgi:hypothetical protein
MATQPHGCSLSWSGSVRVPVAAFPLAAGQPGVRRRGGTLVGVDDPDK